MKKKHDWLVIEPPAFACREKDLVIELPDRAVL